MFEFEFDDLSCGVFVVECFQSLSADVVKHNIRNLHIGNSRWLRTAHRHGTCSAQNIFVCRPEQISQFAWLIHGWTILVRNMCMCDCVHRNMCMCESNVHVHVRMCPCLPILQLSIETCACANVSQASMLTTCGSWQPDKLLHAKLSIDASKHWIWNDNYKTIMNWPQYCRELGSLPFSAKCTMSPSAVALQQIDAWIYRCNNACCDRSVLGPEDENEKQESTTAPTLDTDSI